MEQPTRFVGMDVHKDTIVVAVTAMGEVAKATAYGTIPNTTAALEKLVKRLHQAGGGPLKFCYEAGPCGYGVHRTLTRLGEACMVVAPSMIPRRSGDRQKNDKRDAAALAVLHRGGLLTAVWVADAAHEAMRDLVRARQAAMRAVRTARQQLSAFLLRHERLYTTGHPWTRTHRRWLADQRFDQPAQQIVLEECIEAVRQTEQRRDRVDQHLRAQIPTWALFPLVQNLCALRGLDVIAGAGVTAAIGDPARFATAADFMAYLGLVPSEHSSGQRPTGQARGQALDWRHHQGRRHPRPHPADRSRLELPLSCTHRPPQAGSRRSGARGSTRDCLEGAGPTVQALSSSDGEGQAEAGGGHRDRARAGRLRLGHRLPQPTLCNARRTECRGMTAQHHSAG